MKLIYKIIITGLVLLFNFSCSDPEVMEQDLLDCIGGSNIEFRTCPELPISDSRCTPIYLGIHEINQRNLRLMNFYCSQPGEIINWRNSSGDIMQSKMFSKSFYSIISKETTDKQCLSDTLLKGEYCWTSQKIETLLLFEDLDVMIKIRISTRPDIRSISNTEIVYDKLDIIRSSPPSTGIGTIEMTYVLPPAPSSIFRSPLQETITSIELNGHLYFDVISVNSDSIGTNLYKYYLNQDFGLFAFRDTLNRIWTYDTM